MKRLFRPLLLLLLLGALLFPVGAVAASAPAKAAELPPGVQAAQTLSQVTGIAISPLLGVGAVGAFRYANTPEAERAKLPWYARPWFWVPALVIVGLCLAKDGAGTALPTSLKKPFDVLELFENKASALIATGAVVPMAMEVFKAVHPEGASLAPGLAGMHFAALDLSWLGNLLLVPVALLVYGVVWIVSHSIHVLILVSPFSTVDAALKAFRTALLASVVGSHWISDWMGAVWAGVIVLVCAPLAPWALRLAVFGHVFAWDLLTFRRLRFTPEATANRAFTTREWQALPSRTYGKLSRGATGELIFNYRPLLVLPPKTATLPAGRYAIGRGLFHPELLRVEGGSAPDLLNFPPRFKGHEEALSAACGATEVRDVGLCAALTWIKQAIGFGPGTA
jgi:hypothetical protein